MSKVLNLLHDEVITSASMFAVEFTHPITGLIVRDGLRVAAAGLGPPIRTFSGRFAWNEFEKPAERKIVVTAESTDGRFARFCEELTVPEHVEGTDPYRLLFRRQLIATGLLEPPDGLTAFAGQLLLAGTPPKGMGGATVRLGLREDRQTVISDYVSKTDDRGGFVAVMKGHDEITPLRRPDGTIDCWLLFANAGVTRLYEIPDLRLARLVRAAERLIWEQLKPPPP